MSAPLVWVVGRGGLLGRHVEAASTGAELWVPRESVEWDERSAAVGSLCREVDAFLAYARRGDRSWRVLWCAGSGVVATPPATLADETAIVDGFIRQVGSRLGDDDALARSGALFLASSAGGVYAGSPARHPFDETSAVRAVGAYGQAKLAQEGLFTEAAERCGVDLLIGRLSNLYGPGQNLAKPQGLIAHVGHSVLRRQPISVYVPLDTIRDYLYASDAGRMVVEALERREQERRSGAHRETITKIFASEIETSVASVLGTWRRILRRPLRVALASDPSGRLQPRTLSFRSRIWPELRRQPTPLHLGIDAVRRDQLARLSRAGLGRM